MFVLGMNLCEGFYVQYIATKIQVFHQTSPAWLAYVSLSQKAIDPISRLRGKHLSSALHSNPTNFHRFDPRIGL
ncbi:hypothetical protein HBI34_202590 [Parastagonospora nodorum]|nr:hypothetical protein HBI34_202590 [Parastagonospora nodorum]